MIFLFDLDGTLISTGGAGLRALDKTFLTLYDVTDVLGSVNPSGKTDPLIFREILQNKCGRDPEPGEVEKIAKEYLSHLKNEIDSHSQVEVLQGVEAFLDHLKDNTTISLGLGTGNLEKGAHIKLSPTNLFSYFSFGGFGSDAEDRSEMLKVGHARGQDERGERVRSEDVFIFGDTVLDVRAAKKAGFQSIAVASGAHPYNTLKKENPTYMCHSLEEGHSLLKQIEKDRASA